MYTTIPLNLGYAIQEMIQLEHYLSILISLHSGSSSLPFVTLGLHEMMIKNKDWGSVI